MAIPFNKVPVVPGGIDTRSDPKAIPPAKWAVMTNARFGVPGAVRKRQGYARIAALKASPPTPTDLIDAPLFRARAIASRGDELVAFDDRGPLVATSGRWLRRGGVSGGGVAGGAVLPVVGVSQRTALKVRQDMTLADRATAFGVTMYAWAADTGTCFLAAVDADTGATLLPPTELDATANSRPRVIAAGGAIFVLWLREATGVLQLRIFDAGNFPNNINSAPTVTVASDVSTTVPVYDACVSLDRVLVAYNASTAATIKFAHVDGAGNTDGFASQATAAAVTVLAAACSAVGEIAIVWGMDTNNHVDCRMFGAAKAPLFATQTLNTSDTGFKNITVAFGISGFPGTADVMYEIAAAATWNQVVRVASCTTAGVVGFNGIFRRHSGLGSKLFGWTEVHAGLTGMRGAVVLSFDSPLQPTYFLVDLGSGAILARILPGEGGGLTPKAHLPQVEIIAPERAATALLGRTRVGDASTFGDRRMVSCEFDLNRAAWPMAVAQDVLYVPGGCLGAYDGTYAGEAGFLLFPENVTPSQSAGGSLTALATYSYKVFLEWMNAQGQREMSTTAGAFSITLTGGNQTVQLVIPTLAHTNKGVIVGAKPIGVVVFRTLADQEIFHRVSNPSVAVTGTNGFIANNPNVDTVTFTDQMSDAVAATQEIDYLTQGELENVAPPASSLIAVGNNRIFLSGFENRDLVLASKLQNFGTAVTFNDELQIALPPAGGSPVTALATLGDELIIFRESNIYSVAGPGPDNAGANGIFQAPVTISNDIGCIDQGSLVRTPAGLLFQSRKGIYMLSGEGLSFIGADIARFNDETITSAVSMPDRHEARFTLLSGSTLVFEYLERKWSVWTVGGIHGCIWQGRHVILRDEAGVAVVEADDVFQDDGISYSLSLGTGWLAFAGMQGYQRVRDFLLLGTKKGDHSLRIRAAYDFIEAYVDDVTIDVSTLVGAEAFGADSPYGSGRYGGELANGLPTNNLYQLRHFFQRPKCSAVKLLIEDAKRLDPTGAVDYPLLDSFNLNELLLSVGQKAGHAKPGPDRQF